MTETAKLKRRIEQLEKALADVRDMAAWSAEALEREHGIDEDDPNDCYVLADTILKRINRTLK